MNVLVINCGSSSLKYQLINMKDESVMAIGLAERIGIDGSIVKHETIGKEKITIEEPMKNHKDALKIVLDSIVNPSYGAIKNMDEISAVGHRVVHGGEKFSASVILTPEIKAVLDECTELAPLHNPANLMGIDACEEILPNVPMVAVFDTAFHQTMPKSSFLYGLPYELYEKYGVRRYGFHGTSHKYVAQRAADILEKDVKDLKIISCHLGNGASIAAVDKGVCVDTSMGFTPLEGLIMGTRCGDIDPAIIPFIMEKEKLDASKLSDLMNKKSGVLGMTGISSDFRDIENAAHEGNEKAVVALDAYCKKVKKYIGSYMAELNGVDVVLFTAGIGENSVSMRETICSGLDGIGIEIDSEKNNVRGKERVISTDSSKVKVLIVPTNEELMIARETCVLVK